MVSNRRDVPELAALQTYEGVIENLLADILRRQEAIGELYRVWFAFRTRRAEETTFSKTDRAVAAV
jgi:hypothetical protein